MRTRSDASFDFFRFWHDGASVKAFPRRPSYDRILKDHGVAHLDPRRIRDRVRAV